MLCWLVQPQCILKTFLNAFCVSILFSFGSFIYLMGLLLFQQQQSDVSHTEYVKEDGDCQVEKHLNNGQHLSSTETLDTEKPRRSV